MRGKWAAGIQPRNFAWIIKDRLAISERPGGYARNHRRVRRQEEIIWLREQGFTRIVSLLPSPHNLHAYDDLAMPWAHYPFTTPFDARATLPELFEDLRGWLDAGEKVVVHMEEVSDRLMGAMAAYLLWAGMLESEPQAITILETICHRQMGPDGREMVTVALGL